MPLLRASGRPALIKVRLSAGSCVTRWYAIVPFIQARQISDARKWLAPRIARIKTCRARAVFSLIRDSHVRGAADARAILKSRHGVQRIPAAGQRLLSARKIKTCGITVIRETRSFASHLSQAEIVSRSEEYYG